MALARRENRGVGREETAVSSCVPRVARARRPRALRGQRSRSTCSRTLNGSRRVEDLVEEQATRDDKQRMARMLCLLEACDSRALGVVAMLSGSLSSRTIPSGRGSSSAWQACCGLPFQDHALAIEHVGSTSVPGLAAKPVIDIDIVIEDMSRLPGIIAGACWAWLQAPRQSGHRRSRVRSSKADARSGTTCTSVPRTASRSETIVACEDTLRAHPAHRDEYARFEAGPRGRVFRPRSTITSTERATSSWGFSRSTGLAPTISSSFAGRIRKLATSSPGGPRRFKAFA